MRSTLFLLTASLAFSYLGLAVPLPPRKPQSLPSRRPLHATRSGSGSVAAAEVDDEDYVDLPRLDNRAYVPTATDKPSDVLEQSQPIPTLYLMSLERQRRPIHGSKDHSAWAKLQTTRSSSSSRQDETTAGTARLQPGGAYGDNSDLVVIPMFMAFVFLVAFIEMRHRAVAVASEATRRLSYVVGLPGRVRLEGGEKRLLAFAEDEETETETMDGGSLLECPDEPRRVGEKAVLADLR